jgi:hypothetical protein
MVSSGLLRRVALRSLRRLLVAACVVPSSPIFVTLMKEAPGPSETSVLARTTRRNNPEDTILQDLCVRHGAAKSKQLVTKSGPCLCPEFRISNRLQPTDFRPWFIYITGIFRFSHGSVIFPGLRNIFSCRNCDFIHSADNSS